MVDILLIIYYVIKGHTAKDLFQIWLDNRILSKEEFQRVADDVTQNITENITDNKTIPVVETAQAQTKTNIPSQQYNTKIAATTTSSSLNKPITSRQPQQQPQQKRGLLSKLLENEKQSRLKVNGGRDMTKRNHRFGTGIYVIKESNIPLGMYVL